MIICDPKISFFDLHIRSSTESKTHRQDTQPQIVWSSFLEYAMVAKEGPSW